MLRGRTIEGVGQVQYTALSGPQGGRRYRRPPMRTWSCRSDGRDYRRADRRVGLEEGIIDFAVAQLHPL